MNKITNLLVVIWRFYGFTRVFLLAVLFQSIGFFSNTSNLVSTSIVYYQNYEYLSTIKLNDYNGYYGNVKLLRYSIPDDVLSAIWRLQLVSTKSCPPTNFFFYLEYSGYPVISPHNHSFPHDFNLGRLTNTYVSRMLGGSTPHDKQEIFLNISSPSAGYWYSAAFVDYDDSQVKPDLLKSNCSFYLTASVNLWRLNNTKVLYPNTAVSSAKHDVYQIYKYPTSSNYDGPISFELNFEKSGTLTEKCSLTALLRQSSFPDMTSYAKNDNHIFCKFNASSMQACQLLVSYPMSNTWYYLAVTSTCNYNILVDSQLNCISKGVVSDLAIQSKQCIQISPPTDTFRFIGPTYFSVKYFFNSNNNRSNSIFIEKNDRPYFIEFLVDLSNIGGTLNFKLINNLVRDFNFNEVSTNTSVNISSMYDYDLTNVKIILKVCLKYNSMSNYKQCSQGYGLSTKSLLNQYTNLQMSLPYPMMGKWYLVIYKECYDATNDQIIVCPRAYIPYVVAQLSSDQCANNYCGEHGTCYIVNSNLNLVSACKCTGGYQGYGCTDASNAISLQIHLVSVLFLTLSNLVFLLPIGLALYRRWYIEALIYFYNMFFSTFYHACDQDFYSFCIFNYDGLQLADFIGSYASFVITILSMSAIVRPWKVFSFFVGFLACLSINLYDRFSNTAFIIFLVIAISITIGTWVKVCVSSRKLYPSKKKLLLFYLPGLILATIGIVIYSFLQTKSNYWVLHSIWHMCMASSILFFLPKRDYPALKINSEENLKVSDVTTTSSSLSDSTGSNHTNSSTTPTSTQSLTNLLHLNATETTLLGQEKGEYDIQTNEQQQSLPIFQ